MTQIEYNLLRKNEPWMKLPRWERFTERARRDIEQTTVEDAKVKRLARILGADYVNDLGDCVYHK